MAFLWGRVSSGDSRHPGSDVDGNLQHLTAGKCLDGRQSGPMCPLVEKKVASQ